MATKPVTKVITSTEADAKFGSMVDEASRGRSLFVITSHGKLQAVMLGVEEYLDLLERLEILDEQNDPAFQAALGEAQKDHELGRTMTKEEFDAEFGFSEEKLAGEDTDTL